MINKLFILSHILYAGLILYGFVYSINSDDINNVSYINKTIYISSNVCFHIDERLYSLLINFPMEIVYNSTADLVNEIARYETSEGNTTYHYFIDVRRPEGLVPNYIMIEKINDNRYKGCSYDNSSLSLNSLPWESLTHITDYNGIVPIKKRHLQSNVKHLELYVCTRMSINALKLQKVSFIDEFCKKEDVPNYDYYNRLLCSNTPFHCCSEECIPSEWENDGEKDCFDGSDETGCDGFEDIKNTDKYLCDDGQVVSIEDKCNEKFECQDSTDEDDCYGNKLNAPKLKELLINYRTIMTTDFTNETELSITHLTIYNSSKFDIYSKIDFKRLVRKISGFNNLKSINLSHNLFYPPSKVIILFFAFLNVETFNISYCEIETLDIKVGDVFPYLKVFDISHNRLKKLDSKLFYYMHDLIYVNMSMSFAETDVALRFHSYKKMTLDLSNNKFKNISVHFKGDVEELDLSGNSLKYDTIDLETIFAPDIDKLILYGSNIDVNMILIERLGYVRTVYIKNYTLDCSDCKILKKVLSNRTPFIGTNNTPICTLPEKYKGESVHKVNVHEFCPNPFIIAVIAFSVVIILVIIFIIIVGYKYRFEIPYWIRYTKLKKRKLPSCDYDIEGYVYDAFIYYCGADKKWVWDVLCPGLEDCPQKYHLCLHDRDFPLGTHLFDNTEESFKKSKYCVMVISNNFVQNLLDPTSVKLIQESQEFLIFIKLQELDTRVIPQYLQNLLNTRTCLKWDEENFPEDVLLERLKESLGKSIFERGQETTGNSSSVASTNL